MNGGRGYKEFRLAPFFLPPPLPLFYFHFEKIFGRVVVYRVGQNTCVVVVVGRRSSISHDPYVTITSSY